VSSTVVTSIGELVTCDGTTPDGLGLRRDAAVVVEAGRIAWVGTSSDAPAADRSIDVAGRAVLPGFVDSHAHLVFAGDRGDEFAARMAGTPYDGGGIGVSVAATRDASDDDRPARQRHERAPFGTPGFTSGTPRPLRRPPRR
jgi:imidazolonepropionase